MAALIGQNHGIYALVAGLLMFGVLALSPQQELRWSRLLCVYAVGILVGYLPVVAFGLWVPGYFMANFDALRFLLLGYGGTNLALPVPWPWRLADGGFHLDRFIQGIFFICLPAIAVVGGVRVLQLIRQRGTTQHPVCSATIMVLIPYSNVAFSRADASHLAQAIVPALLAALTLPCLASSTKARHRLVWSTLLAAMCFTAALPLHPRYQSMISGNWQSIRVGKDEVRVDPRDALLLKTADGLIQANELKNRPVVAVPMFPGLNAALNQRNSLW